MAVRAIYGCRQVGAGREHLKKLCCYLNMPEPMLSSNYQNILLKLKESASRDEYVNGRLQITWSSG